MWAYELHLRYRYLVNGQIYVGTRPFFSAWGPKESFNPLVGEIARTFPVRREVMAHYDPQEPSSSVLVPTAQPSAWVALVLGILLAWAGRIYGGRVELEKQSAREIATTKG